MLTWSHRGKKKSWSGNKKCRFLSRGNMKTWEPDKARGCQTEWEKDLKTTLRRNPLIGPVSFQLSTRWTLMRFSRVQRPKTKHSRPSWPFKEILIKHREALCCSTQHCSLSLISDISTAFPTLSSVSSFWLFASQGKKKKGGRGGRQGPRVQVVC